MEKSNISSSSKHESNESNDSEDLNLILNDLYTNKKKNNKTLSS